MHKLPIISARLNEKRGIKGCIFGGYGIGKTSLLYTLPPESTLFFDLEAGDLAVKEWQGDSIRPRTWQECRDFAVYIGGLSPAVKDNGVYGKAHFEDVCKRFGDPKVLDKYETIFIDSITVAGRLCLQWCKSQSQCISERTCREDMRAMYGLHGQEMISWLTHLQHTREKNIWFIGVLEEKTDDHNRKYFGLQIDGNKTGLELPAIVDQVITMAHITSHEGGSRDGRVFINHTNNSYGYPAKDRSGKLEMIEPAHLGNLMNKIKAKTIIN